MTCYHGLQSYRRSVKRKQNRYENGLPLLVAYFHGSTSYLPYTCAQKVLTEHKKSSETLDFTGFPSLIFLFEFYNEVYIL